MAASGAVPPEGPAQAMTNGTVNMIARQRLPIKITGFFVLNSNLLYFDFYSLKIYAYYTSPHLLLLRPNFNADISLFDKQAGESSY